MRTLSPSSRVSLKIRVSIFDALWALIAPFLALLFRDAYILSYEGALTAALYCLVAAGFSIIAFLAFHLRDQMARYFSVHDAIDIAKAVLVAESMIFIVLFTFTRLQGIPRSTPLIHALVLIAGLVGARTLVRLFHTEAYVLNGRGRNASEHIIMIGATRLSSLYIKMLETYFPGQHQIIGLLDTRSQMLGRTIAGVRVMGSPEDLQPIIDEFAVHGIHTTRLIVGGDIELLPEAALNKIKRVCEERRVRLDFVPQLVGLNDLSKPLPEIVRIGDESSAPELALPAYFRFKRLIDFTSAMAMIILFLPLVFFVALLALLDVGFPVLFWQQRIGQAGHAFLIYKIRTLRPPFDGRGHPVPESQRISWIGTFLRKTRLDELPQLLNVLVGDMSLIGPRPLLPQDQPQNLDVRLMVRPGITGWAQVSGGNILAPEEKGALDEWYIRNASLWLDLRILILTIKCLFRNQESQSTQAMSATNAVHRGVADKIQAIVVPSAQRVRKSFSYGKGRGPRMAHGE
jgi:lipopolysaccharide/colanic/teichoic acid biosynthesis glycosyltransferase